MSLRYCLSCKKICDDHHTLIAKEHYQCDFCKKELVYFGREEASISINAVLAEYDALHPYNPINDFSGTLIDYENPKENINIMECEEILKHDPSNTEALRYLSKHYWSHGASKKALDYMEIINQKNSFTSEDIVYYINLLISQKNYKSIIKILKKYQAIITKFLFYHYHAVSYLGLNHFKEALEYFYQAYHQCDDVKRKKKIKKMIRYLSTILDQPIR